ncbi:unnamed protein product [Adineta ricciae]|uniref:3'-5' exonuclease domain-containing protein n=1 Tax=Adineta ricciae TaxID=249248 RepID=A0A813MKQ1_ADIRI|nr:unnamed protein product [Adineta ricciae]CAF1298441.1 unnamed protein product [Adineta ricciae]
MSSLLKTLADQLREHNDTRAGEIAFDHFNQSDQPYDDLFKYLLSLTETNNQNVRLIDCLIQSFLQWETQAKPTYARPAFDETCINNLILSQLPVVFLNDFCQIFRISKEQLFSLLRTVLRQSMNAPLYKRALTIIVKLQCQSEFLDEEILLPLILNSKDHLIHLFVDNQQELEEKLLTILNHLYRYGGRSLGRILAEEFNMNVPNINKKALGKLAVRYWNLYGHNQVEKYPNLASLQHKRTLNYLINVKYSGSSEEKPMSDEAWNEIVAEVIQDDQDLLEFLLEQMINRDDIVSVKYWIHQTKRSVESLPNWMQRYVYSKTNFGRSTTLSNPVRRASPNFYKIPPNDTQIIFIGSKSEYDRLLDRLFTVKNGEEDIYLGFDCEWKPMFTNAASEQRISVMQIAFPDEIFILDMLHFFRTCDSETVQQRLADRLFDDDHVTILCYGFRSDASMLTSSYPVFSRALVSGKTLLDLCLVHFDLMNTQRHVFPYASTNNTPSKDKGLSELVRLCFGIALDKSEQCSNWERRPLRSAQIQYAGKQYFYANSRPHLFMSNLATDAYCLLAIYNFLKTRVESADYFRSFRGQHTKKPDSSPMPKAMNETD